MAAITPEQLTKWLSEVLRERLKSVMLYGSAAAGDFVAGESNYNLLVIVEPLGVTELKSLGHPLAAWEREGHVLPMLFTPQQLLSSLDAFPIEMLDIQQSRRTLFGSDLLHGARIEAVDLRRAVERELTGKLLALRGKYAVIGEDARAVHDLMSGSLSTILVLFRAALRLYQSEVPDTKLDAMRALSRHIQFDTRPFERLYEMKQRQASGGRGAADVSFAAYLGAIERVAAAINQFQQQQGSNS
jgi:hypothetical protein